MSADNTKKRHFIERKAVLDIIARLMENLTGIRDDGEYLLRFGDLVVDDKSWPSFTSIQNGQNYSSIYLDL